VHGKQLAAGNAESANCVVCHGVHDIREVKDPLSPAHPLRLAETCARCHADAAVMEKSKLPTTQADEYRQSVHWEALSKRKDPSAPTCSSCHGKHDTPRAKVTSAGAVCEGCHSRVAAAYKNSYHKAMFEEGSRGCVACHGDHKIVEPSSALLAGAASTCAPCHEGGSDGVKAAAEMARQIDSLDNDLKRSDGVLAEAARAGVDVSKIRLQQRTGRENLTAARVAVHSFRAETVAQQVSKGRTLAAATYQAGRSALQKQKPSKGR
jgi:predicted CXXCH cytochrome family protein